MPTNQESAKTDVEAPEYTPQSIDGWQDCDGVFWAWACSICGALVLLQGQHSFWHESVGV